LTIACFSFLSMFPFVGLIFQSFDTGLEIFGTATNYTALPINLIVTCLKDSFKTTKWVSTRSYMPCFDNLIIYNCIISRHGYAFHVVQIIYKIVVPSGFKMQYFLGPIAFTYDRTNLYVYDNHWNVHIRPYSLYLDKV